jgi:hypothetical protein
MGLNVLGRVNEQVVDVAHVQGNRTKIPLSVGGRPKEAQYRILKADGERVAQGQFEYG